MAVYEVSISGRLPARLADALRGAGWTIVSRAGETAVLRSIRGSDPALIFELVDITAGSGIVLTRIDQVPDS